MQLTNLTRGRTGTHHSKPLQCGFDQQRSSEYFRIAARTINPQRAAVLGGQPQARGRAP